MAEEMVIFTRTYDFLTWLLPATNHFPRAQRFTFTHRLLERRVIGDWELGKWGRDPIEPPAVIEFQR